MIQLDRTGILIWNQSSLHLKCPTLKNIAPIFNLNLEKDGFIRLIRSKLKRTFFTEKNTLFVLRIYDKELSSQFPLVFEFQQIEVNEKDRGTITVKHLCKIRKNHYSYDQAIEHIPTILSFSSLMEIELQVN